MKDLKYILPFIEAFLSGNKVEIEIGGKWSEITVLNDFIYAPNCNLRIVTPPKLVPFTIEDAELFRGKWVKRIEDGYTTMIIAYDKCGVEVSDNGFSYKSLLESYTFEDGSPCGKHV